MCFAVLVTSQRPKDFFRAPRNFRNPGHLTLSVWVNAGSSG